MTNIAIIPTDKAIHYWRMLGFVVVARCKNTTRVSLINTRKQPEPKRHV